MPKHHDYDAYETLFDGQDRQSRRKRKPKAHHKPKKSQVQLYYELAGDEDIAAGGILNITYKPAKFEAQWLLSSLQPFFYQEQITDVIAKIKGGGKEASVYTCEAHPNTGASLLAVKVYRPHTQRQFRNDAVYREGRAVLNDQGNAVKNNEHRIMRAIGKKSAFGTQVAHTSWLMYEYRTLQQLHTIGASVPRPYSSAENGILMEYIGDADMPAPLLQDVTLGTEEAPRLFAQALYNVELLLRHGLIHGDLSAYNILYWQGNLVLIDFPQVIPAQNNTNARGILERDITRLCEYFDDQGVACDPIAISRDLWQRYFAADARLVAADQSRWLEADED
ncbi:MAG: hypothetical protein MUF87_14815 [Anaerolineae bacterium]|jgi:RIO kinase 1|nr:hypothetical protein [Anaerolineae bacterium]